MQTIVKINYIRRNKRVNITHFTAKLRAELILHFQYLILKFKQNLSHFIIFLHKYAPFSKSYLVN